MTFLSRVRKITGNNDEPVVSGNATYNVTYEVWDEESVDIGETYNRGFESKNNKILDIDDLNEVIHDMIHLNNGEWSQSHITAKDLVKSKGPWYSGEYDVDIRTGDRTMRSYHFSGLSLLEAQYILQKV